MNIKQLILVLLAAGTVYLGLYVVNLSKENRASKASAEERYGVVFSLSGYAELRGRPRADSMLMMQILNDVPLQVLGEEGEWVNVRTETGRTGYVRKSDFRY
jgi:SH3-like domain-containing protein